MKIQNRPNLPPLRKLPAPPSPQQSQPDSCSIQEAGLFVMGTAVGAVSVGAPATILMGAAKAALSGHPVLGAAAMVAGAAILASTGPLGHGLTSLMSQDLGNKAGSHGYVAGSVISTGAAAWALFA